MITFISKDAKMGIFFPQEFWLITIFSDDIISNTITLIINKIIINTAMFFNII